MADNARDSVPPPETPHESAAHPGQEPALQPDTQQLPLSRQAVKPADFSSAGDSCGEELLVPDSAWHSEREHALALARHLDDGGRECPFEPK